MENRNDGEISAEALLEKLKANIEEQENGELNLDTDDRRKRYKFRRTEKNQTLSENGDVSESGFESPVPKSDIEDLDVDALMKKYLSEDEYAMLSKRDEVHSDEEDDELVKALAAFDEAETDDIADGDGAEILASVSEDDEYAAPDDELFAVLSKDGKVCDIPDDINTASDSDTKQAPKRSMPADTVAFIKALGGDPEAFLKEKDDGAEIISEAEGDTAMFVPTGAAPEAEGFEPALKASDDCETAVFKPVTEEAEDAETAFHPKLTDETVPFEAIEAISSDTDAEDLADNEQPIDETDANLMIAFGMDDELDEALGKDEADKLRTDVEGSVSEATPQNEKQKTREEIKEFITPIETPEIFASYKACFGKNSMKLFGMAALSIILFFYENIIPLGGKLPDIFNPAYYPIVSVMIGLQLLFLGFALCAENTVKGVKAMIDRKPIPDSFLPLILAVSVIYSVSVCFFEAGAVPITFNFPASLCLLLSLVGERMDIRREVMSFNIISSKRTKFALEKLHLDDAELETKAFDKFLPKQPSVFKINKTAFVDGYFTRTKKYPTSKLVLNAFIPASAAIFASVFVLGLIITGSGSEAAMLAYSSFFFSLPGTVFAAFSLPCFKAAKLAFAEKSAFVGEAALDEYTAAGSISFDDREVFPTSGVKLRSVKVFGSGRLDTVVYNAASVYSILGGPLSDVLNVATADIGRSDNAEILAVDNEGVEAVVDGNHIFMGKTEYIKRKGYLPVSDPDDDDIVSGGEISIMFLVLNDEVVAKLYVRYSIDPTFEVTLKRLYKSGICVGIKTVDPNINDEMLSTKIKLSKYPVRVLKYSDITESRRGTDRTDSGIVSKKSAKALLGVFTLCDKTKHITKTNIAVNVITMITGIIICMAVSVIGSVSSIASVYAALFQAFWLIPMYLMAKFMLV